MRVSVKALKERSILILSLITLLGFLLRIYNLTHQSIWIDESLSLYFSQMSATQLLVLADPSPPLYYLLLHFWAAIFGITELSARLLSVVFATLAIPFMYVVSREFLSKRFALTASLLLAISPIHIFFSQEARAYSLLFLLSLISTFFYLKMASDSKKWALFYVMACVLMIYTHSYGSFILAAHMIHSTLRYKLKYYSLFAVIGVLYVPWLFRLGEVMAANDASWISPPSIKTLQLLYFKMTYGEVFSPVGLLLSVVIAYPLLIFLWKYKLKEMFLLLWFLTPIFLPLVFSLLIFPVFTEKYALVASLPLFIAIALGLSKMRSKIRMGVIVLIILLALSSVFVQQNTTTKDDWNKIAIFTSGQFHDESIFLSPEYERYPFIYYYRPECFRYDILDCAASNNVLPISAISETPANSGWIILSSSGSISNESIKNYIGSNVTIISEQIFLMHHDRPFFGRIPDLDKYGYNSIKVLRFKS